MSLPKKIFLYLGRLISPWVPFRVKFQPLWGLFSPSRPLAYFLFGLLFEWRLKTGFTVSLQYASDVKRRLLFQDKQNIGPIRVNIKIIPSGDNCVNNLFIWHLSDLANCAHKNFALVCVH